MYLDIHIDAMLDTYVPMYDITRDRNAMRSGIRNVSLRKVFLWSRGRVVNAAFGLVIYMDR